MRKAVYKKIKRWLEWLGVDYIEVDQEVMAMELVAFLGFLLFLAFMYFNQP